MRNRSVGGEFLTNCSDLLSRGTDTGPDGESSQGLMDAHIDGTIPC
jgi:hypothetical protein